MHILGLAGVVEGSATFELFSAYTIGNKAGSARGKTNDHKRVNVCAVIIITELE
jgi:hypothetical protein